MVYSIDDIRAKPSLLQHCGGKGRNLFRLQLAGFEVPPLVVLPANSIYALFNIKIDDAGKKLKEIASAETDAGIQLSRNYQKSIADFLLDDAKLKQFNQELNVSIPPGKKYSVRSSVKFEDSRIASFAGMFTTVLDVDFQDIPKAVLSCYASLFDYPLVEYSQKSAIDPSTNEIAVVIQEMVEASVSGVIFTMNAGGNFNDLLISCALGCGEGVVNNSAQVTGYYINRQNNQVRRNPEEPDILTSNQIDELREVALSIEKEMAYPQDIEFSYNHTGKLFILQSRPITTIDIEHLKIIDNTNIVESYPGITMPLSFTFARNGYKEVFTSTARLFGISEKAIQGIEDELSNMITHVQGRVYYNLHNWYKLMQMVVASDNHLHAWETLIGVKTKTTSVGISSVFKKIRSLFTTVSLLIRYKNIVADFYRDFELKYSEFRNWLNQIDKHQPAEKEAFEYYLEKSVPLFNRWSATLLNDFFTFRFYGALTAMVKKTGMSGYETLTNDLLCGMPGVESEELVMELLKIKELINSNSPYKNLFDEPEAVVLKNLPDELKSVLNDYVAKYGDRTLEELKMETPNFRMQPEGLISLIKLQLAGNDTADSVSARQQKMRNEAEAKMSLFMQNKPFQKLLFRFVLAGTRESIRNRENMRLRRTRSYGLMKELFHYISLKMKDKQILNDEKDIFWLTLQELEAYCLTGNAVHLGEIIQQRKAEFEHYQTLTLPDRFVFNGENIPLQQLYQLRNNGNDKILWGTAISGGQLVAECIVLTGPDYKSKVEGKILVTRMTDPAWVFLMSRAAGLISEKGSPLSHTAIVGRELGIPVIIGVLDATQRLKSGNRIQMDCTTGRIEILNDNSSLPQESIPG
jgi:pyruvate,water dikinase